MQQLAERSQALVPHASAVPPELPTLEAQLEASIRTPPVGRVVRVALVTLGLTLLPFFGWATMTTIEQAVLAPGQLIPEGRRKTVNLLEPGILRRLEVREGQVVAAGDTLLQLDVTQAEAQAAQAKALFWGGRARVARLRAEQAEQRRLAFAEDLTRAVAGDASLLVFIEAEQALFAARWSAFDAQVAVAERQITQLQEQVSGIRAQREGAETQVRSTREQIAGLSRLLQQGFASRFTILELQRAEAGFAASIGQAMSQENQLREQIAGAQRQLATIRFQRLQEIATDLQTTEAAIAAAAQQLRAAQDVLARREVTAPEAGKVTNIQAFTPGASIAAGQPILDLVPVRDRFIVEGQVLPTDIEQVLVGQPVNVRLTSYRMRKVPVIPGRVTYVAADITTLPSGASYFTLRAELDPDMLDKLPEVTLQAGMPTEIYVLGERRTPLDYILSPLRTASRRAFRD